MKLLNKVKDELEKNNGFDFENKSWNGEQLTLLYNIVCATEKVISNEIPKTIKRKQLGTLARRTNIGLKHIERFFFITKIGKGWQTEWEILVDFDGHPFISEDEAISFARETIGKFKTIGISNFKQMKMDNAVWDNM